MPEEPEDHLGMTPEQWATFQRLTHGFGDQNEYGIDLSHLRANLRLTPTQRLEKHQQALEMVMEVRRAGAVAGLHRRTKDPQRP